MRYAPFLLTFQEHDQGALSTVHRLIEQTEYQKQFKATTVSIQNCPPKSTSSNSDPLVIPGISLGFQSLSNESPDLPCVSFIDSANPPSNNNFPILPVADFLLSPFVTASHLPPSNSEEPTLEVLIAAALQQSLGIINPSEFSFFYNVVLTDSTVVHESLDNRIVDSKYKMNLYITFNKRELQGSTNVLDTFYFAAKFANQIELSNSNNNINSGHVLAKDITSVEVFVVNTDPETSRGTETTVQPSVGNG